MKISIPGDRFLLSADRMTACWTPIVEGKSGADLLQALIDRPCPTCGGEGDVFWRGMEDGRMVNKDIDCPDCIAGRLLFDIEVDCPSPRQCPPMTRQLCPYGGVHTFQAWVQHVLPIVDGQYIDSEYPLPRACMHHDSDSWIVLPDAPGSNKVVSDLTFPAKAEVGGIVIGLLIA